MIYRSLPAKQNWRRCRRLTKDQTALSGQSSRRVGKSELILQFGKNHPTLYLVGKRAPADQMMHEFLEGASIFLQEPLLTTRTPKTPPSVATYSFGRSRGAGKNGPKTCEFIPWMSFMSKHLRFRAPHASCTR
jgi:hypothetical protein